MKKYILLTLSILLIGCKQTPTSETNNASPTPLSELKADTVDVIEFFDYGCGHCRTLHMTMKTLETEFDEKLRVDLKHYPLNPQTKKFAEGAECARNQDKFLDFHNQAFETYYGQFQEENIYKIAESIGLDTSKFRACMDSGKGLQQVEADVILARGIGVRGTPFMIINNQLEIPGSLPAASLRNIFNQMLE